MIENRLSAILGERRMKISELARGAGLDYASAHRFYSGKTTRYDADVLVRLCAFLGVQVGDLLRYVPAQDRA